MENGGSGGRAGRTPRYREVNGSISVPCLSGGHSSAGKTVRRMRERTETLGQKQ